MDRKLNGKSLMWDDTPQNSSHVGDYFGFYKYGSEVTIHMIIHIASSEKKTSLMERKYWTAQQKCTIPIQGNRYDLVVRMVGTGCQTVWEQHL